MDFRGYFNDNGPRLIRCKNADGITVTKKAYPDLIREILHKAVQSLTDEIDKDLKNALNKAMKDLINK